MIKVQVTLIGSLSRYSRGCKINTISLPEGVRVEEILKEYKIPLEYCSFMTVNGLKVPRSHSLKEGDQVVVFPLVSGG